VDGVEKIVLVNNNVVIEMHFGVYKLVYNICMHGVPFAPVCKYVSS
jgi:hypothetical protein